MPKEDRFFTLFNAHTTLVIDSATEMIALITNFEDLEIHMQKIETITKQANQVTQNTIDFLYETFITPIDRDSLYTLITHINKIINLFEDTAQIIFLYNIKIITLEIKQLIELCLTCAQKIGAAVELLNDMKNSPQMLVICKEIKQSLLNTDYVIRLAISKLLQNELNFIELIKLKTFYETLEILTSQCKDTANIIECIVIEHA